MAFAWFSVSDEPREFSFRCECCGEIHHGSPSIAYAKPLAYLLLPESERDARAKIDSDTCVIDDEAFFIRTILEIPIHGATDPFTWGVWVSQSRESFERYLATYDHDQSGDSSFGWLEVTMPGYIEDDGEDRNCLACDVRWQKAGARPLVVPHESDHRLCRDIAEGISWDRAIELARLTIHG